MHFSVATTRNPLHALVALFLALTMVMYPAQRANAFLVPAVEAAIEVAPLVARSPVGKFVLGTVFTALAFTLAGGGDSGVKALVPGANLLTEGFGSSGPASTTTPVTGYAAYGQTTVAYADPQSACSDPARLSNQVATTGAVFDHFTQISTNPLIYQCYALYNGRVYSAGTAQQISKCPSGYTANANGTSCTLTTPSAVEWPSDGVCDLYYKTNAWGPVGVDPDCNNVGKTDGTDPLAKRGVTMGGGTINLTGGPAGTTTITTDGTKLTVQTSIPDDASSTTSTTTTTSEPTPNDPTSQTVDGVRVAQTPGTGSQADPASAVPSTPTTDTGVQQAIQNLQNDIDKDPGLSPLQLPDTTNLYKSKYPDGMGGVWDSHINDLEMTPLYKAISGFAISDTGGSCPSFVLNLPFGYGAADVSPPCYLWTIIGTFMLFATALLCRRLIFGG